MQLDLYNTPIRIQLPVRVLVESTLRAGDLVMDQFVSPTRAVAGTRAHQKVQSSRPAEYQSEVAIAHQFEISIFQVELSGRIDGVWPENGRIIIEEIKSTTRAPETVAKAQNPQHWAQAKIYAYIYALQNDLTTIDIQLTYTQVDSDRIHSSRVTATQSQLATFVDELLQTYLKWVKHLRDWQIERNNSIMSLDFPFSEYRPGQRSMAVEIYKTVRDRQQLLVQAPTGIGKTVAAVFPALKAIAEGHARLLFYLTARTTGRAAAEQAFSTCRAQGLRFKAVTLTARDKICFNPGAACNSEECEFARGYYDRIDRAVGETLQRDELTRAEIENAARKHMVCPFEFSLDLALFADAVICDYNYAFDPQVYLRRFFDDITLDPNDTGFIFLVDEAHNLVDRSRDMYSATLTKKPFLELKRALKTPQPKIYDTLDDINQWFIEFRRERLNSESFFAEKDTPESLLALLRKFTRTSEKWLALNQPAPYRADLTALYFDVTRFLRTAEWFDDRYTACYERLRGDVRVKLFCMNPAPFLADKLTRSSSAIFFSATLTPMAYFRQILGCESSAGLLRLASPFPKENLCVMLSDRISTRYKDRDRTRNEVADALVDLVTAHPGNYLIFFPSYKYLQMIHELFMEREPAVEIVVQTSGMSDIERETFLDRFDHDNPGTLVGFAVLGGVFGEGIDLVGDRLTGAVIVGVGLPAISPENELIRNYFERQDAGFEFAYLYPGINRVLQAAGRVIRSEQDRGVVYLIDERFRTARYRRLLPPEWQPIPVNKKARLRAVVHHFWNQPAGSGM